MNISLQDVLKSTQGALLQGEIFDSVRGISINSKTVKPGDLFIAIKGQRFDGHDFVRQAIDRGAKAVVVSQSLQRLNRRRVNNATHAIGRNGYSKIALIRVDDTTLALGHIARMYRNRFPIPVIAITGSAGKTTTKEMLAHVLQARYKVLKNEGTENNQIGVPLTLLKLRPDHEIVVIELGTNRPGDIRWLTCVANPTIAVMTNVGESHLELLKSLKDVFREKFELVKRMESHGQVIVNRDDEYLKEVPALASRHAVFTFGVQNPADYQASQIEVRRQQLKFQVNDQHSMILRSPVVKNVYNALATISCARLLRIDYETIRQRLQDFRPARQRQDLRKVNGFWVIDDTYNANPVSFRSAIETLNVFRTHGRKILVCGDMLELGKSSIPLHRSMGELAGCANLDMILTYGNFSQSLSRAAKMRNPRLSIFHYHQLGAVHRRLQNYLLPGDVILVKGSRGMHMERTVEFLLERLKQDKG